MTSLREQLTLALVTVTVESTVVVTGEVLHLVAVRHPVVVYVVVAVVVAVLVYMALAQ